MNNQTILVTGGTGSLGNKLTEKLITKHNPKKVIVFSRNEHKQVEMERFLLDPDRKVRYFIGDVRDKDRLYQAFKNVDIVIHCAALKHVDKCQYNPSEVVKTNIYGAENVISASLERDVKRVLAVSTDKAVNPINLYGAAKLCADFLFVAANVYSGKDGTRFSVVRSGNFWNSNGSVVEYFRQLKTEKAKQIPLTDRNMTRFFITLEDVTDYIIDCIHRMKGGEVFTPKMMSMRIDDLAKQIYPEAELEIVGKRPGEKLHEEIILPDGTILRSDSNCVRSFST